MRGERTIRLTLKVAQFFVSAFIVYCLFRTGPHWMLTLACLTVPPFGVYLMMKSPDQQKHELPHRIYLAVAKGKSWLRVDVTICLTMGVVFLGFALILFYGFFQLTPQNTHLLLAGIGSLVVSVLYTINAFVSISQLRSGTVDFASTMIAKRMSFNGNDMNKQLQLSRESGEKVRPITSLATDTLTVHVDRTNTVDTITTSDDPASVNYRSNNLLLKAADHYSYGRRKSSNSYSSGGREQLDASLETQQTAAKTAAVELEKKCRYAATKSLGTNYSSQRKAIYAVVEASRQKEITTDDGEPEVSSAMRRRPPSDIESGECSKIGKFNEGFVACEISTSVATSRPFASNQNLLTAKEKQENASEDGWTGNGIVQRQRRFASKNNDPVGARRRFSRSEESSIRRSDKSSDDDSASASGSGSLGSVVHEYENSTTLERSDSDVLRLANAVAMSESARAHGQAQYDVVTDGITDSRGVTYPTSSGGLLTTRVITHGPRPNSSLHNYYTRRVYRRQSSDDQFANYGYVESDEETAPRTPDDFDNSSSTQRSAVSSDRTCMRPIVASIDSNRESQIMRKNSPKRNSSRAKKMASGKRSFDVVIRAQSESELTVKRPNNTTATRERPVDSYFVTEF